MLGERISFVDGGRFLFTDSCSVFVTILRVHRVTYLYGSLSSVWVCSQRGLPGSGGWRMRSLKRVGQQRTAIVNLSAEGRQYTGLRDEKWSPV